MGRRERERERERRRERENEREGERERKREGERERKRERERNCVLSGEWRCEGLEGKVKKQEKTKKRRIIIKEIYANLFVFWGLFRDGPDQGHVHVNASRDSPLAKNG